jgi:hypothetical protein
MANLILEKNGEFWQVFDADRGLTVFSSTNQGVAQAFINNGVVDPETVRRFAQQTINYQGGIDTAPSPVSPAQNSQVPAVPTGQVRVFGDSNTTTTITPATTGIGEGQVRVFGDATTTDTAPATTGIGEGQVRVFGDATTTDTAPTTPRIGEGQVRVFGDATTTDLSPTTPRIGEGQVRVFGNEVSDTTGSPTPATAPEFIESNTGLNVLAEDVDADPAAPGDEDAQQVPFSDIRAFPAPGDEDAQQAAFQTFAAPGDEDAQQAAFTASNESAARDRARQQQTISQQRRQINNGDWRVRLRLAPQAKYLYNAPNPGILQPLQVTDGVIFPYTPSITSNYKANYSTYDLTHSNYRGYFYQNSYAEPVQITCTFTAQSTMEANYLLAVITFFKSVTKMFYGQDAQRGAPPPLTYLTGLGEYQFNEHPCLVTQFNYTLPADVDYIRAGSPNQLGTNQINQRDRQSVSTGSLFGGLNRLAAALLTKGAIPNPPAPPTLGTNRPTYVPTKIELSFTLLPIQSRNQVSKQFSVKEFANGNLIKGGFW